MNKDIFSPEGWIVKRIGEICNIDVAKDVRLPNYSKTETTSHKYPIYSNTVENYGFYGFYNFEEYKGGTITVVGRGVGLGTAFARSNSYGAVGRLLVLHPKKVVHYKYIAEYINSRINILVESAAIPQLTGEQIATYKVLVPPFPEQQKITKILSTWDNAIEKQAKLIEKLELRKRGLMQQLLTGKKRVPGYTKKWETKKIKEIFQPVEDINNGYNHIPMTISARLGLISQQEKFDRVIAGDSLKKYTLIKHGDFVYNKGNSNLYEMGCIYQLETEQSAVVPFVYICFRSNGDINSDFYKYFFLNHGLDRLLKKIISSGARGDGLLNVNKEDFFELTVPYTSIEEQAAISKVIKAADLALNTAKTKRNFFIKQKKALMQQLLTGKTRVKL